jgi:hypothetical protein
MVNPIIEIHELVDQPFGTGFSQIPKSGIPKTIKEAALTFAGFLKGFLSVFSTYDNVGDSKSLIFGRFICPVKVMQVCMCRILPRCLWSKISILQAHSWEMHGLILCNNIIPIYCMWMPID